MNISIEKKRGDYAQISSKMGSSKNNFMEYYNPQQQAHYKDALDYQSASRIRHQLYSSPTSTSSSSSIAASQNLSKKLNISASVTAIGPIQSPSQTQTQSQFDYRTVRSDASLIAPIRQTASIFKQPVTVIKSQEGKVKSDLNNKQGSQEKPRQLFWEKRLESMYACDSDGSEFPLIDLPKQLKPIGPHVKDQTLFQSVATALHSSIQPITGQTTNRTALNTNPGVFVNPDQPLLLACSISEEDIRKQEERVNGLRKKLQEALAN